MVVADQPLLRRRRSIHLALEGTECSAKTIGAYLALVDRPLVSLLARERLQQQGRGRFCYRSRPMRLLHRELQQSMILSAEWVDPALQIRSTSCCIEGLGTWGEQLGIALAAELVPAPAGLGGWAEVGVSSRLMGWPQARQLTNLALDVVLERMERRVQRGLRQDLLAWLGSKDRNPGD